MPGGDGRRGRRPGARRRRARRGRPRWSPWSSHPHFYTSGRGAAVRRAGNCRRCGLDTATMHRYAGLPAACSDCEQDGRVAGLPRPQPPRPPRTDVPHASNGFRRAGVERDRGAPGVSLAASDRDGAEPGPDRGGAQLSRATARSAARAGRPPSCWTPSPAPPHGAPRSCGRDLRLGGSTTRGGGDLQGRAVSRHPPRAGRRGDRTRRRPGVGAADEPTSRRRRRLRAGPPGRDLHPRLRRAVDRLHRPAPRLGGPGLPAAAPAGRGCASWTAVAGPAASPRTWPPSSRRARSSASTRTRARSTWPGAGPPGGG